VPVLFVLGSYQHSRDSEPSDLLAFLQPDLPRFEHWMVCAFGRHEVACVTASALLGGHVRVGFENNLLRPDGALATDNAAQVAAVAAVLRQTGCELQNAHALRATWAAM
jgi:3-keto-5-aminohexanoate cleavage enzyme